MHLNLTFVPYILLVHNWPLAAVLPTSSVLYFLLAPTWSLAVEEQFYLVIPWLSRSVSRRHLSLTLAGCVAAGPFLRFLFAQHSGTGFGLAYVNTLCRTDQLSIGLLIAMTTTSARFNTWARKTLTALYGIATILAILVITEYVLLQGPYSTFGTLFGPTQFALLYGCIILILIHDRGSRFASFFRSPWLRSLGEISYCAYLAHFGILYACHHLLLNRPPRITDWPGFTVTLFSLAVTIVIARLSWKYFEQPLITQAANRFRY